MDRNTFMEQLDEFTKEVGKEGLRLYDSGIAAPRALKLAIDVVTARQLTKAEESVARTRAFGPLTHTRN